MGRMTAGNAMEVLGLLGTALNELTQDDVMRAFRKAVVLSHPDTSGGQPAPHTVTDLLQAKKTLLGALTGQNNACRQCKGRGRVPHRMGTRQCSACKGTGETKP